MFRRIALFACASLAAVTLSSLHAQTPKTVWDGVFSADQAARGRLAFSGECAECHGGNLEGGEGKALSGDQLIGAGLFTKRG
jgi:mono/diheme cytochrome c family protein